MNEQKTVRVARADKQKTNDERTKDEQKTVRVARADKEKMNKRRTVVKGIAEVRWVV